MHRIGQGRSSQGSSRKAPGRAKTGFLSGHRLRPSGRWNPALETLEERTVFDASLAITEVMYNPLPPQPGQFVADDFEFIEIQNISAQPVSLSGAQFTLGVVFTFGDQTLQPGAFTVVVKNQDAFISRYGAAIPIAGVYTGLLSNTGEELKLVSAASAVIADFTYDNGWFVNTNGDGFSLVPINPADQTQLNTINGWRPSGTNLGSPGAADIGIAPNSVVLNEIISHTDLPLGDWIELHNTTNQQIDVGAWFLSQNGSDLTKYKIPAGTVIPAGGYVSFTQFVHFGNAANPDARVPFALSELGESVFLSSVGSDGTVGGYRDSAAFGAADQEVPFGRYVKSTGAVDFVSLVSTTRGSLNSTPLTSPVVINEVMYTPAAGGDEYIELYNTTTQAVPLFDTEHSTNTYEFNNGITFVFPPSSFVPAAGFALVTALDPTAFRTKYSIPANVPIYGPYVGNLNDTGEALELIRPGKPEPDNSVPELLVDRVNYKSTAPWPTGATATGASIVRISPTVLGNDPLNWRTSAVGGTPGRANDSPTLSITDASVAEGNSGTKDVVLTVSMSTFSDVAVTVNYATLNDSASSGSDYNAATGVLTFSPGGALSQQVTVTVKGDVAFESNETFFVKLTAATNATIARAQGAIGIDNDDAATAPANKLVVSELLYSPLAPPVGSPFATDDFEFIELQNVGTQPMNITGARIDIGVDFTFGNKTLAAGERVVIVRNQTAFASRYPGVPVGGVFAGGTLSNGGEQIHIVDSQLTTLVDFTYSDGWYPQTDGVGYALVNADPIGGDDLLSSRTGWQAGYVLNGSPGAAEQGPLLPPDAIVINEILASTDRESGDFIELYNTTNSPINIGGWYLSDSGTTLNKFRIPAGTTIPAKGYIVFTQTDDFGSATNPAALTPFSLSSAGETVYVTSINPGDVLGGYRLSEKYDPEDGEVPFGRYFKSTGGMDFVALQEATPGAANAPAKIGPIVISEILYQPALGGDEFIELHNISSNSVKLYDPANDNFMDDNTWQFTAGVTFSFPPGVIMAPGSYLLVTALDPIVYRAKYAVPADVQIFGPYTGTLTDAGEAVEIAKPRTPEPDLTVPYIIVDRINYRNVAPWPVLDVGGGPSIVRVDDTKYGNDGNNWVAGAIGGTPGVANNLLNLAIDNSQKVAEGAAATTVNGVFVVTLSGPSTKAVTVAYTTAGGTATSGQDFTPQSGILTFAPGQLTQLIPVPVIADTTAEPTEFFQVTISTPVGAAITRNFATGSITDASSGNLTWQNTILPQDVNADSLVNALDVLLLVNEINANGTHTLNPPSPPNVPPPFYDVNNDSLISPLDVVIVVNYINAQPQGLAAGAAPALAVLADNSTADMAQGIAAHSAAAGTDSAGGTAVEGLPATTADDGFTRVADFTTIWAPLAGSDGIVETSPGKAAVVDDELPLALEDELDGILADLYG